MKKKSPDEKAAFAKARAIALALPGVYERISWGEPNWLVGGKGGKMFAAVGPGHGGPHLAFKAAGGIVEGADARFKPMSEIFKWSGTEDWFFYFFDFDKRDQWDQLKHLIEVSWELHFAKLPKKKQDAILPPADAPPARKPKAKARPKK